MRGRAGHGARAAGREARGEGAVRARGDMRVAALLWVAWGACLACAALATPAPAAAGRELRVLQADSRSAFFVGIAAPPSAAAAVRAFNRSLAEISQTYLAGDYPLHLRNVTLQPLYIELPEDERYITFLTLAFVTIIEVFLFEL